MPVFFWHPSWLKKADRFSKGLKKFVDSNSDLIETEKLATIRHGQKVYDQALKGRDRETLTRLEGEITTTCERAVPGLQPSALQENAEVILVAVIVALGIRAYWVQPFKIPTASMQPTLNGIIGTAAQPGEESPNALKQAFEYVWRGRNYIDLRIPSDWGDTNLTEYRQYSYANFFTFTELLFANGKTLKAYAPIRHLLGATGQAWNGLHRNYFSTLPADDTKGFVKQAISFLPVTGGDVLARGYVDTGDQLLVDKFSYHFRRPQRGEVFVFSTKGVDGIREHNDLVASRQGVPPMPKDASQHYIKRLTALPGDELQIKREDSRLYINGKEVEEELPRNVGRKAVSPDGRHYSGYTWDSKGGTPLLSHATFERIGDLHVKLPTTPRYYMAMGDNSPDSFDSRGWGPVPEKNLVGPAMFVYWPFSPHWGRIH